MRKHESAVEKILDAIVNIAVAVGMFLFLAVVFVALLSALLQETR